MAKWNGSSWICANNTSGPTGAHGSQGEQGPAGDFSNCRICIYYADQDGNTNKRMMCTRMIDGDHSGRITNSKTIPNF